MYPLTDNGLFKVQKPLSALNGILKATYIEGGLFFYQCWLDPGFDGLIAMFFFKRKIIVLIQLKIYSQLYLPCCFGGEHDYTSRIKAEGTL